VYSPVAGVVAAVNERLADAPETVNADPYGDGWLVEVRVDGEDDPTGALLDAAAYQALVDAS
jgi:glycine cleavage system H protein